MVSPVSSLAVITLSEYSPKGARNSVTGLFVIFSIAVLEVDSKIYKTTLEIGEVAGQIKHKAKAVLGSTYVINKRRF